MPVRHRSRTNFQGRARRKLVWSTVSGQSVTLAAGTRTTLDMLASLEVAGSSTLGVTIMRTHLMIQMQNWNNVADQLYYGLIVCRTPDIGAGNGPDPAIDFEEDWMLNALWVPVSSAAVVDAAERLDVDNRSKRKMEELGQRYGLALKNQAGLSKTFIVFSRILVALP